jgi:hypothetical protein
MKLAVGLAGLTLCGGLLATAIAEDPKPAGDAKPAEAKPEKKPDPHFVEPGDFFFLQWPENTHKKGTIYVGYKTDGDNDEPGTTLFRDFTTTNYVFNSKEFYRTRPAKPEDLYVGRRIIYPGQKIDSRAKLEEGAMWKFGRIASFAEVKDLKKGEGEILVAGFDPADLAYGVRVIVGGDKDLEVKLTGSEDRHFFHPEHRLIYVDKGKPDADGHDVVMAILLKAPEKDGEPGTYLSLYNGDVVTSKYAYKTRPATKADLKAGLRIALPERSVEHRHQAYRGGWWVGDLTSVEGGIARVGNGTVRWEQMRVIE